MLNGIKGTTTLRVENLEGRDVPSTVSAQTLINQVRTDVTKLVHDSVAALNQVTPVAFRAELKHDLQVLRVDISHRALDAAFADLVKIGNDIQAQGGLSSIKSVWTNPTVRSDFTKLQTDAKALTSYFASQFLHNTSFGSLFQGTNGQSIQRAIRSFFGSSNLGSLLQNNGGHSIQQALGSYLGSHGFNTGSFNLGGILQNFHFGNML